jgi:hypothetical protein
VTGERRPPDPPPAVADARQTPPADADPPERAVDPPAAADPPEMTADPPPRTGATGTPPGRAARRPPVERVGMAAIAVVLAVLFGGVAALSFASGEPFLGVMAMVGTLMTAWAGLLTLLRG